MKILGTCISILGLILILINTINGSLYHHLYWGDPINEILFIIIIEVIIILLFIKLIIDILNKITL